MARITVEDCLDKVDNRFELVMVSSKRARQIQTGGKDALVSEDNDKPTVIALREIADGKVNASILVEKPNMGLDEESAALLDSAEAQAGIELSNAAGEQTVQAESTVAVETEAKEQSTPPED